MSEHAITVLSALRIVGALVALILVIMAARAWKGSRDPRMLRLGIGFGLILVSIVVEGLSFQFLFQGDLMTAHLIEASFQVAAMGVFIWALF